MYRREFLASSYACRLHIYVLNDFVSPVAAVTVGTWVHPKNGDTSLLPFFPGEFLKNNVQNLTTPSYIRRVHIHI